LPPEGPEPYKPKMLVRYAGEPPQQQQQPNQNQQKTELVCLVYSDASNSETCGTVTLMERHIASTEERVYNIRHVPNIYVQSKVYDIEVPNLVKEEIIGKPHKRIQERDKVLEVLATTRSKRDAETDSPRKEKKSKKKKSKEKKEKEVTIEESVPQKEPETGDGAYDRYDPKYYLPNIAFEMKQCL
jgi:hypothetical protein